jgi:Right handed beta helix region
VSYTLRGRLESRLVAALAPLLAAALAAAVLREWWPLGLAALMLGVGLVLDAALWHGLLPYQPGWAAVPIAFVELAAVIALARVAGVEAPLGPALALYWGAWFLAQVFGHAVFPVVRITYGEDGGELGRLGSAAVAAALVVVAFAGGVAWATAPPTVHLERGVHRGPIVLDRAQTLDGEEGTVVRGGIVIRADGVRVRDLTVVGGETGIAIFESQDVVLEDVTIVGARVDGIAARQSSVEIRDCTIRDLAPTHTQGIDISFSSTLPASVVEGCDIHGGAEGIATQMAHVEVRENDVRGTTLRGISLNEMSMGVVEENVVRDALGIGILCMDYSSCDVEGNRIVGTRPDPASQIASRAGYAIVAHYGSTARVRDNELHENAAAAASFIDARVLHR